MRIERLEIDGFGRFHDAQWALPDGLTVLLGANEAGKTTLLNALRALLFGFESSRDGRAWYPALAGGRRGGRLVLLTREGERWTVERHGERGGGGALAVRAPNGNQGGQETLDRLLHGADKDLFNNIFAFGLGELQTFASLSADGVRGRIYGAGAGLGGTSAIDLERRLRGQMDASFLPRGSQRPLNQLLARIEELRREVADLSRQPEEHAAAHRERDELCGRADALRAEGRLARERVIRLQQLRSAGPVAAQLAELEAQLADGDATLDDLPEDAVVILDRRLGELKEARAVLVTVEEQLADATRSRAAITIDRAVLDAGEEIVAITEERAHRAASASRRRDLAASVERQEAAVAEQRARAGGWEEARLLGLDDAITTVEATREHEAALAATKSARAEADQRHRAVEEEVASLDLEVAPALTDDEELAARSAALQELDDLRLERAGHDARAGAAGVPAWAPIAGGALVLAVVALAGTLIDLLVPALLIGFLLAGAVVLLGRRASQGVADASDLETRHAAVMHRLGLEPGATPRQIAAARDELAAQRARRELAGEGRARLDARRRELERRQRDLAGATAVLAEAEAAWRAWLSVHGLPEDISPDAARHLLAAAGTARRAAAERDHHRRELSAIEEADAAFRARAGALLRRLEIADPTQDADRDARLVGARERLDRARTDERRAAELDERIAQLEARRLAATTVVDEHAAGVDAHLRDLDVEDPDVLRRRAAAAAARREIRAAIRERRERLAGIAGGPDTIDGLVLEARRRDVASLIAAETEAREALERIEADEREANNRIGALDARIRQLEAAEELGARRQELAGLEGQAAALAREWAVRALTLRLIEETRARYERERQPDVVRAAESHFGRITGGRYARIVAPPGDVSVRVETEGGTSRVTEQLSRGTAEQLYLALRFGLIEEFAQHAEPLPVVMDDILVNFDADRADRAASSIRDLAARHQVLYFTCHPWTAELLDPDGQRTLTLG
ncbi:MAG TPA: AAA family ATPase [Candidatus Limnocylindria bacterium]|nr:AAA family ATPase [Candidatus Limnocylindria bacterium]